MPEILETLVRLEIGILIRCAPLEGKHLGTDTVPGEIVRLSKIGGDAKIEGSFPLLSNLKIDLMGPDGQPLEGDIYAKVIDRPADPGCIALRFTSVPPPVKKILKAAIEAALDGTQH
jgi:adenylate cyclase